MVTVLWPTDYDDYTHIWVGKKVIALTPTRMKRLFPKRGARTARTAKDILVRDLVALMKGDTCGRGTAGGD